MGDKEKEFFYAVNKKYEEVYGDTDEEDIPETVEAVMGISASFVVKEIGERITEVLPDSEED